MGVVQANKDGPRTYFRIGLVSGIVALALSLGLQAILLRQLSVFNTTIGLWLMALQFVLYTVVILILTVLGSFICSTVQRRTGRVIPWALYYAIIGLAAWGVFSDGITFGLNSDVKYTTLLGKSGIDYLSLHYLNGATIWTLFALTALFMLSDPRVTYRVGDDGKRHAYMHSKFLGLIRLLRQSNLGKFFPRGRRRRWEDPSPPSLPPKQVEWDVGQTPDHAVISKDGKIFYNDRFRVSSPWFLGWTFLKFLLGILTAEALADNTALRFLTIQNYLARTGSTWLSQLSNYFGILGMRISGAYVVPPSFAIDNTFTFEVYSFVELLLGLAFILIGLRLGLAALANVMVGVTSRAFAMSRRAVSEILGIALLPMIYFFLGAGSWVYDVGTALNLWALMAGIVAVAFFAALARTRRVFTLANINRTRAILLILIVIIPIVTVPSYGSFLRGQSGKYIDYQWNPAYVPTIQYTRWAYQVDNVTSADQSLMTSGNLNQSQILSGIRIFTQDAAKLYMKPLVPVNWMSINNAGVDIIFFKGNEYWVSLLQLVHPPSGNDPDEWRTDHLLLTNSEKILAVNAASGQPVDMSKLWNLTQTPQLYYGEGGLWASNDEVYLNIPTFNETHITGYTGPTSYDAKPDYVYTGFWRYWKFFWQGRLDFANGNYGNIKALVNRDVDQRVQNFLLPGMTMDSDPYPVVDDNGNLYLLHWVWIDWKSPHDFADYPDHQDTSILRLFAPVLTNLKTGEVHGYLFDQQRNDYILSFYRSMYPQWNQPIPSWLVPQLRYPEGFFDNQTAVYDFYFQTDPLQWQRNVFLQNTEESRFIITPINGVLTWAAVRLVETYQSPSKILSGLYIAPAGANTGHVYLMRLPEGTPVIGPESAISAVTTDPSIKTQLTLHSDWVSGNILLYAVNGRLTYVIPYYGTQSNLNVPVMVAAVDGSTKQVGHDFIQHPNNATEVQNAANVAVQGIGLTPPPPPPPVFMKNITGTVANPVRSYIMNGNTQWIIDINNGTGTPIVTVFGSADKLTQADRDAILLLSTGNLISVTVDINNDILKVNP